MFTHIDTWIRRMYGRYGVGLSLFFIAVSPYSGSTESAQQEERDSDSVREYAQQLHQQMAQAGVMGALGVDDSVPTDASLYNLYLTKAPVAQYGVSSQQNFLPVNSVDHAPSVSRVEYDHLFEAYLDKVEAMIVEDRDYVTALTELDKVQIIAPTDRRVHYLKMKVTQAIKKELQREMVPAERASVVRREMPVEIVPSTGEDVSAERDRKRVGADVPMQLDEIMNDALRDAEDELLEKHAQRAQRLAENHSVQMPSAQSDVAVESVEEPVLRDVPIAAKDIPVRKVSTQPKVRPVMPDVASQFFDGTEKPIVPVEKTVEPIVDLVPQVTISSAAVGDELAQTQEAERSYNEMKEQYESPAKKHIVRGKRYFRQKQYALALISFSKAREYDYDEIYASELKNLIRLSKDRLETITNTG